jgi:hypothetical protein
MALGNTVKQTLPAMSAVRTWLKEKGLKIHPNQMKPAQLQQAAEHFKTTVNEFARLVGATHWGLPVAVKSLNDMVGKLVDGAVQFRPTRGDVYGAVDITEKVKKE